MKRFLLTLLIAALLGVLTPSYGGSLPTLVAQQKRAEAVLWFEQKQFQLDQITMTIKVLRAKDMKEKTAWGAMELHSNGPYIEILAEDDYEPAMTVKERKHQLDEIVVHELLHVLMIQQGVPHDAQDSIIEAVRPGVKIP